MTPFLHKLPQGLYNNSLKAINNIGFSSREIDIISCLLSGRSAKTTANLLSITPRTVEAHSRNITLKLEGNSRESIREFFEKNGKFQIIRDYYSALLVQCSFESYLRIISKKKLSLNCLIFYRQQPDQKNRPPLIHQLDKHLKILGNEIFIEARENLHDILSLDPQIQNQNGPQICIVDEDFLKDRQTNTSPKKIKASPTTRGIDNSRQLIFLVLPRESTTKIPQEIIDAGYIDCNLQENYYVLFFEILKKILPFAELNEIIENFTREYGSIIHPDCNNISAPPELEKPTQYNRSYFKIKWLMVGVAALGLFGLLLLSLTFGFPHLGTKQSEALYLKSDVQVSSLLNRSKLIQKIDQKLSGSGDIKTLALIGIGGIGKTTLARQYAHSKTSSVIWEINAESKSSLANSFEALASTICKTDEEKKVLRSLIEVKNIEEKEEKIIQLIRNQLKAHPNWILIYDNVENFSDIQKYFPSDVNLWGHGKVIITTRDTHIPNNSYIQKSLWIPELESEEKLSLFIKIMNREKEIIPESTQKEPLNKFLEKIPSFPLDISIAAYYIKATNTNYESYIKFLNENSKSFSALQNNVLKESSGYSKTRYHIITLALEKLISIDKNFGDLLYLISALDSQNIPRDLLDNYKGKLVVDNFIYHLKKYSLLLDPSPRSEMSESYISIHRSTQDIGLAYLTDSLKINKDSPLVIKMAGLLDDYLDEALEQEEIPKMRIMASHLEKFLSYKSLLPNLLVGLLEGKLGCVYYYINDSKSHQTIESSLKLLNVSEHIKGLSSENKSRLACSLVHIGAVYTELRMYAQAQDLLEKASNTYGKSGLNNSAKLSWTLSHLGNVYRRVGNYEKAKIILEESIRLNKQYEGNAKQIPRTLSCLGSVYTGLGLYEKSREVLEESLNLCKKHYSQDHFRVGKVLKSLGTVYRKIGDYKKSKEYIESSLVIFKKYFPENHINIGLALAYLGNCLRKLGEYEKSCDCLQESLKIHYKYCGDNHAVIAWISFHLAKSYKALGKNQESQSLFNNVLEIYDRNHGDENIETARLLRYMAEIYLDKNHLDNAKNCIKRSLNILNLRKHVEAYKSLEVFGEIYLKQSIQSSTKNSQESHAFKNQAIDQFNQALKIIDQRFPENSMHRKRILSKIKNLTGR